MSLFSPTPLWKLAADQLDDAERKLLDAQGKLEYYEHEVRYQQNRVERLKAEAARLTVEEQERRRAKPRQTSPHRPPEKEPAHA